MSDTYSFAGLLLLVAAVGVLALLSNRLTDRIRIPASLLVFVAAAVAVEALPNVHQPPEQLVERLVTTALIFILFDGGLNIGWTRFRVAAAPIAIVGVLGTCLTVAAAAVFIHYAFALSWYLAVLVATAISPTDPAVVFSVLGQREVAAVAARSWKANPARTTRSGLRLWRARSPQEASTAGLSGASQQNSHCRLVSARSLGYSAAAPCCGSCAQCPAQRRPVPAAHRRLRPDPVRNRHPGTRVGVPGRLHRWNPAWRRTRTVQTRDRTIPHCVSQPRRNRRVRRPRSHGRSEGTRTARRVATRADPRHCTCRRNSARICGTLAATGTPEAIRTKLRSVRSLKGAVPILLGSYILAAHVPDAERLYGIVVVVVVFSVLVQGSLVPTVAHLLHLPIRTREPEPWSLGVRLAEQPDGVHRFTITPAAPADGRRIDDLPTMPEEAWISLVVRDNRLLPVRGDSQLRAGDQLLIIANHDLHDTLTATFATPQPEIIGLTG